jgi:hypothetical protein
MGVAALVLGILGTLLALNPFIFYIAVPMGILALVLGVVGRKQAVTNNAPSGTATAGMVLGIVTCCISLSMWILCTMIISGAKSAVDKTIGEPLKEAFEKAKKDAEEEAKRPVALDREHALKVTAARLQADYESNEPAADTKYKGKTLEVSGVVRTVGKDLYDARYVTLEAGQTEGLDDVRCMLAPGATADALATGQKTTLVGRCDGKLLGVKLKGCVLK